MFRELDSFKLIKCIDGEYYRFGSRGWDYTNPLDAAKANDINLNNNLTSVRRIMEEKDGDIDFEDWLEEIKADNETMEGMGITRTATQSAAGRPPENPPAEPAKPATTNTEES